jgi:hypothetical protein
VSISHQGTARVCLTGHVEVRVSIHSALKHLAASQGSLGWEICRWFGQCPMVDRRLKPNPRRMPAVLQGPYTTKPLIEPPLPAPHRMQSQRGIDLDCSSPALSPAPTPVLWSGRDGPTAAPSPVRRESRNLLRICSCPGASSPSGLHRGANLARHLRHARALSHTSKLRCCIITTVARP